MIVAAIGWLWLDRDRFANVLPEDGRTEFVVDARDTWVADGDSFTASGYRVRLDGIDAPEHRQTCARADGGSWDCGKVARAALGALIEADPAHCLSSRNDDYGRRVATCSVAGRDIAAAQVEQGLARATSWNGVARYVEEERRAQTAGRGIWQGAHVDPAEWRRQTEADENPAVEWRTLLRRLGVWLASF